VYADEMIDSRADLVHRLTAARDQLARQIDLFVSGGLDYGMKRDFQVGNLIAELQNTLAELEDCIAALDNLGGYDDIRVSRD
jgi:hypothetical protein